MHLAKLARRRLGVGGAGRTGIATASARARARRTCRLRFLSWRVVHQEMYDDCPYPARDDHDLHACSLQERGVVLARLHESFADYLGREEGAAWEIVEGGGRECVEDFEGVVGIVFVGVVEGGGAAIGA